MRIISILAVCVVISACGPSGADTPTATITVTDRFEGDDTKETSSEVKVWRNPEFHTVSPELDIDWVRVRVDEVDPDGSLSGDNISYWIPIAENIAGFNVVENFDGATESAYSAGLNAGWYFYPTTPGIYYVAVTGINTYATNYEFGARKWRSIEASSAGDYFIGDVVAPTLLAESETFTISIFAGNMNGVSATGPGIVTFYLSTDDVWDGSDYVLTGVTCTLLSTPQATAYSVACTMPTVADLGSSGAIYLIARLSTIPVDDYDDSNNSAVTSLMFGVTSGDSSEGDGVTDGDNNLTLLAALARGDINEAGNPEFHTIYPALDEDIIPLDVDATDISTYPIFEIYTTDVIGGLDTCIELLDATGAVIATAERGALDDNASRLVYDFTTDGAGDYYIRVTDKVHVVGAIGLIPATGATGSYGLVVRKTATSPDGYEFDDTFNPQQGIATWRELKPTITGASGSGIYQNATGETLSRSFHWDSDVDYLIYPVKPLEDGYTRTHSIGCNEAANLSLYDASGNLVAGPTATTLVPSPSLEAGLYYIKIEPNGLPVGTTYDISATIANTAL